MASNDYCIIIPNYNHTQHIENVLQQISQQQLPVILINDGSNAKTKTFLIETARKFKFVSLIHLETNQGKGGAVITGLLEAHRQGYSHAIQVDADGQHAINDIPKFINLSEDASQAVICGIPDYDKSVPLGRLIPRYITHFWVWVETLSFRIKDSMCGFRLYPLSSTTELIRNTRIGKRMDFDTEILVKLDWKAVPIINLPTKVTYPEDGSSHFRMWQDNWLITKRHTRLFFGMLVRLPKLIARHFTHSTPKTTL